MQLITYLVIKYNSKYNKMAILNEKPTFATKKARKKPKSQSVNF